jgi:hypothetical protein
MKKYDQSIWANPIIARNHNRECTWFMDKVIEQKILAIGKNGSSQGIFPITRLWKDIPFKQ